MIRKSELAAGLKVRMKANFSYVGPSGQSYYPWFESTSDVMPPWDDSKVPKAGDVLTILGPAILLPDTTSHLVHIEYNGNKGYMFLNTCRYMEKV